MNKNTTEKIKNFAKKHRKAIAVTAAVAGVAITGAIFWKSDTAKVIRRKAAIWLLENNAAINEISTIALITPTKYVPADIHHKAAIAARDAVSEILRDYGIVFSNEQYSH